MSVHPNIFSKIFLLVSQLVLFSLTQGLRYLSLTLLPQYHHHRGEKKYHFCCSKNYIYSNQQQTLLAEIVFRYTETLL